MEQIGFMVIYLAIIIIFRFLFLEDFSEKISIKIKSKNKPELVEPIYNIKHIKDKYYEVEKYEIKLSTNSLLTFFAVFLIYPIYFYHWKYELVDNILLNDIDIFNISKDYYIQKFNDKDKKRQEENERKNIILNKKNELNKEFNDNYNKLNK
jgi:hypothetical protein